MKSLETKGYLHLRHILSKEHVESFVQQIKDELTQSGQAERCVGAVDLEAPLTWPKKGSRRVVECAPTANGNEVHWDQLRQGLTPMLNTLLGENQWELPFNRVDDPEHIRHFYCPITFPEHVYPSPSPSKMKKTT